MRFHNDVNYFILILNIALSTNGSTICFKKRENCTNKIKNKNILATIIAQSAGPFILYYND